MAEYEERSLEDLTEEPSPQRLDELRKKGTVAQSRDLTSIFVLFGVTLAIYAFSSMFVSEISGLMREVFSRDVSQKLYDGDWREFISFGSRAAKVLILCFIPVAIAAVVFGVLGSLGQIGFMISPEVLNPDFNRINPTNGFKKVYSVQSLVEGAKSFIKLTVVMGAVYFSVSSHMNQFPDTVRLTTSQTLAFLGILTWKSFLGVIVVLFAAAVLDYWIQWRRFRKQAMMTKAEAKQDLKEREGDPQIRARIRSIQRETARKRMMKAVPTADVVITNPTHIAIAIVYAPEENLAPKVIAKGADYLAERIKKIARENGVPTVENKPLARTLYKHVKVGQMIPRSLYQAVAEILAYVYKLRGRKMGTQGRGPTLSQ